MQIFVKGYDNCRALLDFVVANYGNVYEMTCDDDIWLVYTWETGTEQLRYSYSKGREEAELICSNNAISEEKDLYKDVSVPSASAQLYLPRASKKTPCFVASVIYDSPLSHEVAILREWRDTYLSKSLIGRLIIRVYYKIGPSIARSISQSTFLRKFVKRVLDYFVNKLRK